MQERLLQFIWQEKYFNLSDLKTVKGETLLVLDGGILNTGQGPDFTQARISLNGIIWAGNIEMHLKSSQWHLHKHGTDPNYNSVILHVVWEDDDAGSIPLPTLVMEHRVASIMLDRYAALMQLDSGIGCRDQISGISEHLKRSWVRELVEKRLQQKASLVLDRLDESRNSWEETCWWWLARFFGGPVNGPFFEAIARSIPFKILLRHRQQVIQLEAILLGQANLLQEANADPYVQLLQREYRFLLNKYKFPPVHGQVQLLRMRPAGFPAVRLAQLAKLIYTAGPVFTRIMDAFTISDLELLFQITANDFWHYHYTLQQATPFQQKHLGREMAWQLIINAISPLVYAIGWRQQQPHFQQQAINWLLALPPEKNSIQQKWKKLGLVAENAAESQGLTELINNYCYKKNCLECKIGCQLLGRSFHHS